MSIFFERVWEKFYKAKTGIKQGLGLSRVQRETARGSMGVTWLVVKADPQSSNMPH